MAQPPLLPPPPLTDDLIEECLLRLPPDEPANLVHAALVCKGLYRIIAGGGFSRRFRELHGRPPMLGFFHEQKRNGPCFTPTSSFRRRNDDRRGRYAIDCRHGRVLLSWAPYLSRTLRCPDSLSVWDPISGDHLVLPERPPPEHPSQSCFYSRAAVLCASGDACDHLDCHRGHFLVVCVDHSSHEVCIYVYMSKTGAWSHSTSAAQDLSDPICLFPAQPIAMAENALYFSAHRSLSVRIMKYDLGAHEISWLDLPPDCSKRSCQVLITTTEYGELGIARVVKNARIHLWSREAGSNGVSGWAPSGDIELETTLPVNSGRISLVTFVHGLCAFFIRTNVGAFTVDLVSKQARKVFGNIRLSFFVPYTSFFTPALSAAFTGEEPTAVVPGA